MIDYEKLKLAHDLADQVCKEGFPSLCISFNSYHGGAAKCGHDLHFGKVGMDAIEGVSIDEIIAKLQELIKSKPKYSVGQTVFIYDHEEGIHSFAIAEIDSKDNTVYDECCGEWRFMEILYESKNSLIEDQISYWEGLKDE